MISQAAFLPGSKIVMGVRMVRPHGRSIGPMWNGWGLEAVSSLGATCQCDMLNADRVVVTGVWWLSYGYGGFPRTEGKLICAWCRELM